MCPARGRANPEAVPSLDPVFLLESYANGGVNPWGKTDYAGNPNIMIGNLEDSAFATAVSGKTENVLAITDGTSSTILLGEKSLDPRAFNSGGWLWDEPVFAGGGAGGTVRNGSLLVPDAPGNLFMNNWGSAHPGGVVFVFADGSVRVLTYNTSVSIMSALLSPRGGEVVGLEN
jgi:prepilin-type processing-associated H-X9-DG protein